MTLLEFFKKHGPESRREMAAALGICTQQINNIAYCTRRPNVPQAARIAVFTAGTVSLKTLRPDIDWEQMRNDLNQAA